MKWSTVVTVVLVIACAAAFPSLVDVAGADRPESEGKSGSPLNPGETYPKTRDPDPPQLPGIPRQRAVVTAPNPTGNDGLSVAHVELSDGRQQTTVIDVRTRTMAVYHIDSRSGVITLKSVRNLGWDLQIDDYNSGKPPPREIRTLVEKR